MLNLIKQKMNSDRGAVNSIEVILLIALAVFTVLAISRFIITPMVESSKGIGLEIQAMDPRN